MDPSDADNFLTLNPLVTSMLATWSCIVGVALYQPIDAGSYQWALANTTDEFTWRAEDVKIYQITDRDAVSNQQIPWAMSIQSVALATQQNLIGIIHVGKVECSVDDLDSFIRELGPDQDGYDTRGRGWNCGTYVLKILESLIEAGLVHTMLTPQELILEGEVLGARLEQYAAPDTVPIIDMS